MKLKVKSLVLMALVMTVAVHSLKAEPVDTAMVKAVAGHFFRSISPETSRSLAEPVIVHRAFGVQQNGERRVERDYYYIVNMGREGYVIVAADSRVNPILAYSTTSSFDGQRIPSNMAFFLNEYQEQMDELDRQSIDATYSVTADWERLERQGGGRNRNVVVGPLITSKWAQSPYYNAYCPVEPRVESGHAAAGCTAVALGQILRYWRYPEYGVGSHSYLANNSAYGRDYGDYGVLTADFGHTHYDYDNMPDSLTAHSSPAEVNAVATLIYHCGVSLDMAYGLYNSSAVYSLVDDALRNYFDYSNPQHVYRSVYSESGWINLIKDELDHLRPVFYTGVGTSSIHAFICDGYDDQGYFHFNWGWGGYADGYFLLSNLNPNLIAYNTAQTAVIHVEVDPPAMQVSEEELTFFVDEGAAARVRRFNVQTTNVETSVNVSVSGDFMISADSVIFATQLSLPANGGTVYVKYTPSLQQAHYDLENVFLNAGICHDSVRLVGVTYFPECSTPVNFTAVQGDIDTDTNQVMLTWQNPSPDLVNVSWDSVAQSSFGDSEPYFVLPMHRMSVTDLLPFHKHRLTHISFIAQSEASEYRLMVYKGGRLSKYGRRLHAGTLIHEQNVNLSSLTMNSWNTVALDTPIVIDASEELWYGLYIAAPAYTSTVVTGGSDCVQFKGNIYGYDFSGEVFWYPYSHNFVLKAVIDNPFVQYEVFRDGDSLAVLTTGNSYADYPPEYAHYLYEVKAAWNDGCEDGVSQVVNFRAPCHVVNLAETIHACDSFVWNDSTYMQSGDYLHEYWNVDDCWQVDTLHLTIGHTNSAIDEIVACDSLTWINGITYTESTQTPVFTLTNAEQCDSIVTLHLTIKHSSSFIDNVTACDSIVWIDGNTYTESTQEPTFHYTNAEGCDSLVTLHLTILHSSSSVDTVDACDSYTWKDGVTYTESTDIPTVVYENAEGCDSIVTLHLTIRNSTYRVDSVVSCQPYTWIDGVTYTESTDTPTVVYENAVGCDSIVSLRLIFLQASEDIDTVVACDAYTWLDGNTYTESVVGPVVYFTDVIGCDNATLTLNLTILHSSSSEDTVVSCDTYTWIDGNTYTESTDEATMTYTNSVGCDSVVTLHLTVYHSVYQIDEQFACDSFTWIDGNTYTEDTDMPTMTYTSASGCDSVVTLHLTVHYANSAVDTVVSETPYTWIDGNTYTESVEGPTVVLTNEAGCDSVVTLHLDIVVSVEDHDFQKQLRVYPNPSDGMVRLILPQELTDATVELRLYDMYGKLLQRQQVRTDNPQLDLSHYAQGMYVIQVYQHGQLVGNVKISKLAN